MLEVYPGTPELMIFMISVEPKVTSMLENHSSIIRVQYLLAHAQEGLESTSVRGMLGKMRPPFLPLHAYCIAGEGGVRCRLRSNRENKQVPRFTLKAKKDLLFRHFAQAV